MTQVNGERNPVADFGAGHPFTGAAITSAYTRAQAIEDGELVDVSETAREAGFKYPVALTRGVWSGVVVPPSIAIGESCEGRLWDVLYMLSQAIRSRRNTDPETVHFKVIATDETGRAELRDLWAKCGPGDTEAAVITVMLTSED